MSALDLRADGEGAVLKVRAVPGAKRPGIVGVYGDALKVAVSEPPERGKANRAILSVLADELRVDARSLQVIAGLGSRDKRVRVAGCGPEELRALIDEFREALRSRGSIALDEERFGDAAALSGVSRFVARVKCAMLAWVAAEDLLSRRAGV